MWWIYFDNVAGSPVKPVGRAPYIWIYSHLPLAIGLTAFGVGIKKIIFLHGTEGIPDGYRLILGGALATVLVFAMLIELATTRPQNAGPIRLRAGVQFAAAAIVAVIVHSWRFPATGGLYGVAGSSCRGTHPGRLVCISRRVAVEPSTF